MSDFVETLRNYLPRNACCSEGQVLASEAADEIERLTAERDRQYDQNVEQIVRIAKLQAVVDAAQRYADAELDPVLWDALAALEGEDGKSKTEET